MRLDLLAHEEGLDGGTAGEGRAGDRVSAHRHPANRGGVPGASLAGDELRQGAEAGRAQDRALGVDQVVGGGAAREHNLTDHQGVRAQLGDQPLPRGGLCV